MKEGSFEFDAVKRVFLGSTNNRLSDKATKSLLKIDPDITERIRKLGDVVEVWNDQINSINLSILNDHFFKIISSLIQIYRSLKKERSFLDFDDLIHHTASLLRGETGLQETSAWVLYKLDGGIDHVLVDEAQDTNADQWSIVASLVDEFHAGLGAKDDRVRTLFVVGDEKQSIYSFQRADPAAFRFMHRHFSERWAGVHGGVLNVDLDISFRSVPPVLKLVDYVFQIMK